VVFPNKLYQFLYLWSIYGNSWCVYLTEVFFIEEDINFVNDQDSVDSILMFEQLVQSLQIFHIGRAELFIEQHFLSDLFEVVFASLVED
jgi:hypothetical protein